MTDLPKRRRGRPSKAEAAEHKRLLDEQQKAQAETQEAKEEVFLSEILHRPFRLRREGLVETPELLREVFSLARVGATQKQIAGVLGVTFDTFRYFIRSHEDVQLTWDAGRAHGDIDLLREQLALAKKQSAMAIFLGKNNLGQKDVHEVKNTTGKEAAIGMSDEELIDIVNGVKKSDKPKPQTLQ